MIGNWETPRATNDHLSQAEIARMRVAFDDGRSTHDIADELRCSTRIASKYYATFRGVPQKRGRPKYRQTVSAEPKPERPSRFYKSNFEL